MKILAHLEPLPTSPEKNDALYRVLEIKMQEMGHLVDFREKINWTRHYDTIELGDEVTLNELKKAAAKNDGVLLFYAKIFKRTLFKHLILHPNNYGYYLPFYFEEPFTVNIKGTTVSVGSTSRLLDELNWMEMMITKKYNETKLEDYWYSFRLVCQQSISHNTPLFINKKLTEYQREEEAL